MKAPGAPGSEARWAPGDKSLVGCALRSARLWFTIGQGIVTEVYYPRVDIPQIRDLDFVVADGRGFWVDIKTLPDPRLRLLRPGTPAVEMLHHHPRFTLRLQVCPDPVRDVLLVEVELTGDDTLRPYVLLTPRIGESGDANLAWAERHHGRNVLWAEQGPFGIALLAANGDQRDTFERTSAGYVGASDGLEDFRNHGRLTWAWDQAGPGNVMLTGEIGRHSVLALGIGSSKESAATLAAGTLAQPFVNILEDFATDWLHWHGQHTRDQDLHQLPARVQSQFKTSAMVLRSHMDRTYPGAMVASLSIPWGDSRDVRGGYHLVWPRDLVECAGALLVLGAEAEARNVLRYLIATQHEDGHWNQNQWLGGKPYWLGVQLDEAAFPVLLAAMLAERNALDGIRVAGMVRAALGFIAREGPASDQDRWEENRGVNTFTLSVCIAALVAGSRFLDDTARDHALALADFWNANLEHWTSAADTALARRLGVTRYYMRIAPSPIVGDQQAAWQILPIKNRVHDPHLPAEEQVGTDFLQLVRFGLREADDPLILDSLKIADTLLKVDTPTGPSWYRYHGDGYGEHRDGSPYDGAGRGRAWPLLTGERAHYELAAGYDPLPLIESMCAMTGGLGMFPEQIWDSEPIPGRRLYPGRPTGSAMPLAWTHAEFIKLVASRQEERIVDCPTAVWARYHGRRPEADRAFWSPAAPISRLAPGQTLTIWLPEPARLHFGYDGWQHIADRQTRETGLGLHAASFTAQELSGHTQVDFTWQRHGDGHWSGEDFSIRLDTPS
ncbi:MAG: glycoside hydrolase family 15 protein [Gammaproteobacteria bacterium]